MEKMTPVIAVIGGSSVNDDIYEKAVETGVLIAKRGALLVCGGLSGVMEAACKGAKSAGGITIGILPGKKKQSANAFVDIAVPTGISEARNAVIVNMADALVAIDGKEGTLSELAFALKQKKPVAGIETFELRGIMKAQTPKEAVEKVFSVLKGRK